MMNRIYQSVLNAFLLFLIGLLVFTGCKKKEEDDHDPPYDEFTLIRGADLSFLPEIEQEGTQFFDFLGEPKDALTIFRESGMNTVRLRLWNDPVDEHSSLREVSAFAGRIREAGLLVWLDIHYSDTWADPGKQTKPAAWESANFQSLKDSVYAYTRMVLEEIKPDMVQIGNEINGGFLWETGRLENESDFIDLLNAGVSAARDFDSDIEIMIHFAGWQGAEWFYDLIDKHSIDYDHIGISFYPRWHGTDLNILSNTLQNLSDQYDKGIILAEIGYPFTLGWNDQTHNIVGLEEQLVPGYPATPEGQKQYLLKLRDIIVSLEEGKGFCYWAPDWVAFRGPDAANGSPWENQALFDFENRQLPGMELFTGWVTTTSNR
jgi:arabinogalactan endo-1,4-beta-galactosidase